MDAMHLHQIPLPMDQWCNLTAMLSCAEEGALMRMVRHAWSASVVQGEPPGSLPDDDVRIARALGGETEHISLIRKYFRPSADGRLCWAWLANLYELALGKYERRKQAAAARWSRVRGKKSQPATAALSRPDAMHDPMHLQPKEVLRTSSPRARTARTRGRAPDAARAAEGRTAPALPVPIPVRPPPAPFAGARGPSAAEIDHWRETHPSEAEALGITADAHMASLNPRWRESKQGGAIRTRWMNDRIAEQMQCMATPIGVLVGASP